MGKTGGRELNYVSDVDVVFVAEPGRFDGDPADTDRALRTATMLAANTMRLCREIAWEVDAALRPEGKDGALVRTLASYEAYYQRWASTWEFQALLKARAVAGDLELGARYEQAIRPFVWSAAERPDFVADVQAMRRRVVAHIPSAVAHRELKLGRGGLRDVEFAVQLLQLVHGRGDDALHLGGTLPALDALRDGGYVGRDDALSLADAYTFLRATEHRLQLRRLQRTHLVPDDPAQLTWLALAMGFRPDPRGDARAVWNAEWALHTREVRRLHEKLFYRPLLEAVARVPSADLRLTPEEAGRRLAALGFADPARALQHLDALTSGLSRRATLQRALLPVLLSDFADAPDPDAGLLAYRRVSDALGATPWYLRLLRDEGQVASRLAHLLGTSQYVARMLGRAPEALRMLAADSELTPRAPGEVAATMQRDRRAPRRSRSRRSPPCAAVRRTELLRTAFADLLGLVPVEAVCEAISATTEATLETSLQIALRAVAAERGLDALPLRFAIIAMGRLGGSEVGYGSDADVMFVFEPAGETDDDVTRIAQDVAGKLRALLSSPSSTDPPLGVDADLRPEGRNGPLARSLASYAQYYQRWSSPWEAQALLRARFACRRRRPRAALHRDDRSGALPGRRDNRVRPDRDPPAQGPRRRRTVATWGGPVDAYEAGTGRTGRHRMDDAAAAIAACGPHGGAAHDPHAGRAARRGRPRAARPAQADALATAWRQATRLRNAIMLVRDKAEDQIPSQGTALVAVGRALGYAAGFDPGAVVDDWRRGARRARKVVEDVFYARLD